MAPPSEATPAGYRTRLTGDDDRGARLLTKSGVSLFRIGHRFVSVRGELLGQEGASQGSTTGAHARRVDQGGFHGGFPSPFAASGEGHGRHGQGRHAQAAPCGPIVQETREGRSRRGVGREGLGAFHERAVSDATERHLAGVDEGAVDQQPARSATSVAAARRRASQSEMATGDGEERIRSGTRNDDGPLGARECPRDDVRRVVQGPFRPRRRNRNRRFPWSSGSGT